MRLSLQDSAADAVPRSGSVCAPGPFGRLSSNRGPGHLASTLRPLTGESPQSPVKEASGSCRGPAPGEQPSCRRLEKRRQFSGKVPRTGPPGPVDMTLVPRGGRRGLHVQAQRLLGRNGLGGMGSGTRSQRLRRCSRSPIHSGPDWVADNDADSTANTRNAIDTPTVPRGRASWRYTRTARTAFAIGRRLWATVGRGSDANATPGRGSRR